MKTQLSKEHLLLLGIIFFILIFAGTALTLLSGCPETSYRGGYLNVTHPYKIGKKEGVKTNSGVRVVAPKEGKAFYEEVDRRVAALEKCLLEEKEITKPIRRGWFGVYVPNDWYVSTCSKEQLVPSKVNPALCEAKGITIPIECRYVMKPTAECPCVCNVRAAILFDYWIVTGPNLKLFKAELSRLVTGKNNPWKYPNIVKCLK